MPIKTTQACFATDPDTPSLLSAVPAVARRQDGYVICPHMIEGLEVYPSIVAHVTDPIASMFAAGRKTQADARRQIPMPMNSKFIRVPRAPI